MIPRIASCFLGEHGRGFFASKVQSSIIQFPISDETPTGQTLTETTPRERASDMWDDQIGIFGSWTQQPVVRALLIVGAGIGITFVEPLLGL